MKGLFKKNKLLIEVSNLDQDKVYDVKIEPFSEKRTKSMNSYYWVLVTELASKLNTSKDELHAELIKRYAPRDYLSMLSQVNINDYFPYYDLQSTYKSNGNTFKSYLVYKRSSDMNKNEFRGLLDGLISECHECGISTMTPQEIELLKYLEGR
jgi:hypothetical protein